MSMAINPTANSNTQRQMNIEPIFIQSPTVYCVCTSPVFYCVLCLYMNLTREKQRQSMKNRKRRKPLGRNKYEPFVTNCEKV